MGNIKMGCDFYLKRYDHQIEDIVFPCIFIPMGRYEKYDIDDLIYTDQKIRCGGHYFKLIPQPQMSEILTTKMTSGVPYFKKWDVTINHNTGTYQVVTHVVKGNNYSSATIKRVPKNKYLQKIVIAFYKFKNWWYAI